MSQPSFSLWNKAFWFDIELKSEVRVEKCSIFGGRGGLEAKLLFSKVLFKLGNGL